MPRDAGTVAKYVVGGLALAAMLALAPFFLASGLMAPGWAVGVFIGSLAAALWPRLRLDQTQATVGSASAIHRGRDLVRRHECRGQPVAGLDGLTPTGCVREGGFEPGATRARYADSASLSVKLAPVDSRLIQLERGSCYTL